jgi:hypothetical protein
MADDIQAVSVAYDWRPELRVGGKVKAFAPIEIKGCWYNAAQLDCCTYASLNNRPGGRYDLVIQRGDNRALKGGLAVVPEGGWIRTVKKGGRLFRFDPAAGQGARPGFGALRLSDIENDARFSPHTIGPADISRRQAARMRPHLVRNDDIIRPILDEIGALVREGDAVLARRKHAPPQRWQQAVDQAAKRQEALCRHLLATPIHARAEPVLAELGGLVAQLQALARTRKRLDPEHYLTNLNRRKSALQQLLRAAVQHGRQLEAEFKAAMGPENRLENAMHRLAIAHSAFDDIDGEIVVIMDRMLQLQGDPERQIPLSIRLKQLGSEKRVLRKTIAGLETAVTALQLEADVRQSLLELNALADARKMLDRQIKQLPERSLEMRQKTAQRSAYAREMTALQRQVSKTFPPMAKAHRRMVAETPPGLSDPVMRLRCKAIQAMMDVVLTKDDGTGGVLQWLGGYLEAAAQYRVRKLAAVALAGDAGAAKFFDTIGSQLAGHQPVSIQVRDDLSHADVAEMRQEALNLLHLYNELTAAFSNMSILMPPSPARTAWLTRMIKIGVAAQEYVKEMEGCLERPGGRNRIENAINALTSAMAGVGERKALGRLADRKPADGGIANAAAGMDELRRLMDRNRFKECVAQVMRKPGQAEPGVDDAVMHLLVLKGIQDAKPRLYPRR